MRSADVRLPGSLLLAALCMGCGAGSSAFKSGRKAELHKDYDTALVEFQKAVQTEPENSYYLIHEKLARTNASLFHLKRGRQLLEGGRPDEASGEFQKAVRIDPTNEAAAQELQRLLTRQAAEKQAREKALQQALKPRTDESFSGSVQLKPFPKEEMKVKLSADSRKVFESLGKLANLNVVFPSDYQPRPISVDLGDVKIEDALKIVGLQTKSFWKAVTPNTILVVQDTPTNRRDYEDQVLRTIHLSNSLQPSDRTAITTALKQILGLLKVVDNPDSNSIIVLDTPEKVAAAERMVRDLDEGKAEILIEVVVLEADRDRIRDLGMGPATISSSGSVAPGLQIATPFNPAAAAANAAAAAASGTTLSLFHPGKVARDYSFVLPSAGANAVLNDSRSHILQNPQVRVTDGQTAKLNIGSRVPYATGSFLPSLGGIGGGNQGGGVGGGNSFGLLASTQFQFQDLGVNLELTPHLLSNGDVSIKARIDISSQGPAANLGGLQQPTFNQRKIEHQIQLKEGEVSVLGGLIESTVTRGVTGLPFLGQIPILRYFFSTEHSQRVETEVLVMLTPHVVRLPEYSGANSNGVIVKGTRPPDFGPGPAFGLEPQP